MSSTLPPFGILEDVDISALRESMRPVLDVIDPAQTTCVAVEGRFIDLADAPNPLPAVGADDLVTMAIEALAAGEVPVGPLAYSMGTSHTVVGEDGRTGWVTSEREPGVVDVIGVLSLLPDRVLVAGSRYGWIPQAGHVPSHLLLADYEAMLAETRVYVTRRAAQIGYRGRIMLVAAAFCEIPGESIVLRRFDEESGELLTPGEEVTTLPPVGMEYEVTEPDEITRRRYFDLARATAQLFGASGPQYLTDPHDARSDDIL